MQYWLRRRSLCVVSVVAMSACQGRIGEKGKGKGSDDPATLENQEDVIPVSGPTGSLDAAGGFRPDGGNANARGDAGEMDLATDSRMRDSATSPFDAGSVVATMRRAAVAVGYGGIRLTSLDGGRSWMKTGEVAANGGDDVNLIRAVAWGRGLWIGGGWGKWWISVNGLDWEERPHKFGIIQGLAYGNDMFMATEMDGRVHVSLDGETWSTLGNVGVGNHTRLVFGNGTFAASGDSGATATSKDGKTWERISIQNVVAFCDGAFKNNRDCYGESLNAGFWVEGLWLKFGGGGILMSDTGRTWTLTYRSVGNPIEDLTIGWAPEKK